MNKIKKKYPVELLFLVLSVVILFIYLVLRSVFVPFSHDEAATFFHYVHINRLFPPITREEANNHYLNTLLSIFSYHLLGSSKWALRLPNILASIMFFYYLFRISMLLSLKLLRYGFFISVAFSLHFLDFFALSRGYGLSMAFLIGSMFYSIQYLHFHKTKFLSVASIFIFFMLSANLATIIPAIAFLLLHVYTFASKNNKKLLQITIIFIESAFMAVAIILLLKLKNAGALYLGTPHGGLFTAIKSWLILFTNSSSIIKLTVLSFFFVSILISIIYNSIRNTHIYFNSTGFVFDFVLWLSIAGSVLASVFFDVYYPEGRVGLYVFPLFMGSLFFATDNFPAGQWRQLIVLPALFFPVQFLTELNFTYAQSYKDEVLPKRFFAKVVSDTTGGMPTIAGYHMTTNTWAYYDYKNGGRCNLIDYANFPSLTQVYQILDVQLYPEITKWYDTLDYEPISHLALMKRKKPVSKKLLKTITVTPSNVVISKQFFNLFKQKNNITNHNFLFDVKLSVWSNSKPLTMWLVLQALNNNHKSTIYKFMPLDWLKDKWQGKKNNLKQSFFSGKIPASTKIMKLYLWNINKQPFSILDGKIYIYKINY